MTFGEALEGIKDGERAQRAGWNGQDQYVELALDITYHRADGTLVMAAHDDVGSAALAFVGTRGTQIGWLASQSDMLATDWKFV